MATQLRALRLAALTDAANKTWTFGSGNGDATLGDGITEQYSLLIRCRFPNGIALAQTGFWQFPSNNMLAGNLVKLGSDRFTMTVKSSAASYTVDLVTTPTAEWYTRVLSVDFTVLSREIKVLAPGEGAPLSTTATGSGETIPPFGVVASTISLTSGRADLDIAEIAIWDGPLSQGEVDQFEDNPADAVSTSANLIAHWVMDTEDSGDTPTVSPLDTNLSERVGGGDFTDTTAFTGTMSYVDDGPLLGSFVSDVPLLRVADIRRRLPRIMDRF